MQIGGAINADKRITPACAGKSAFNYGMGSMIEDHPCVCREKVSTSKCILNLRGSPLRVQGKALC